MSFFKILKFIIYLLLFLFSFLHLHSYNKEFKPTDAIEPYCSGLLNSNYNYEIESLEVEIIKNKKWSKNLFNLHLYYQSEKSKSKHENWLPDFRIEPKYKKKFNSNVIIRFKNSKSCIFKSNVRITGDLWWHVGWSNGAPITSLSIELLEGNINSIVKFKLLIPGSRNGDNEIFTTHLIRKLGFLSPKTFYVNAKVNGNENKYIFQEDLRKEFIENSNFKEGPILEGDERFTIDLRDNEQFFEKKTNLSRLINKSYSAKNEYNSRISLEAVSSLNMLYLLNHNSEYPKNFSKNIMMYIFADVFFENKDNQKIFNTYDALIYALDAGHGLSPDDRRFYFNPIDRTLLPIYYDGKSLILEKKQRLSKESLKKYSSKEAKFGASEALRVISKVNKEELILELKQKGVELSLLFVNKIFDEIVKRLEIIKESEIININTSKNALYFSEFRKEETENKKLVFTNFDLHRFFICDFELYSCDTIQLQKQEYIKYLSEALSQDFDLFYKDFKINNKLIFVHADLNYEKFKPELKQNLNNWKTLKIDNVSLEYNLDVNVKVDNSNKEILINQKNINGIALLKNGSLNDWKIYFNGSKSFPNSDNNIKSNIYNLTGCLNFYNLLVKNLFISISDANCEDGINLVKTSGSIDSISVKNSSSDSIDGDFSFLEINNVVVNNSKNDCLDLSYGNYRLKNISLSYCGDKGVSIGENSSVKISNLNIDHSIIGLASKDSSKAIIEKSKITNSSLCFAAYRKKQEFLGGRIDILDSSCGKDNVYQSNGSEINFLN